MSFVLNLKITGKQLDSTKACFWFLLGMTRVAFSLGLTFPYYWGNTFLHIQCPMNYEDFTFSPWEYELVPAWCEFQTFFSLLLLRCFLSYLLSQRLKGDPLHVLGVLCVCVCVCVCCLVFCPVNPSCSGFLPLSSYQFQEMTGFTRFSFPCAATWKLFLGSKWKQS